MVALFSLMAVSARLYLFDRNFLGGKLVAKILAPGAHVQQIGMIRVAAKGTRLACPASTRSWNARPRAIGTDGTQSALRPSEPPAGGQSVPADPPACSAAAFPVFNCAVAPVAQHYSTADGCC